MLADEVMDPHIHSTNRLIFAKELSWLLLNVCCFPECEANAFFESECNVVECASQCMQKCNEEINRHFKEIRRSTA